MKWPNKAHQSFRTKYRFRTLPRCYKSYNKNAYQKIGAKQTPRMLKKFTRTRADETCVLEYSNIYSKLNKERQDNCENL